MNTMAKAKKAKPQKTKTCQGEVCGGKRQPIENFPNSPHAADGKLGYCRKCWSDLMRKARAKGKARRKAEEAAGVPQAHRKRSAKNAVDVANEALSVANKRKEKFLVQIQNGAKVSSKEFTKEARALKWAMEGQLKGHKVRIWREVEFQMVLRIIG
jgi:hypothetical protein